MGTTGTNPGHRKQNIPALNRFYQEVIYQEVMMRYKGFFNEWQWSGSARREKETEKGRDIDKTNQFGSRVERCVRCVRRVRDGCRHSPLSGLSFQETPAGPASQL